MTKKTLVALALASLALAACSRHAQREKAENRAQPETSAAISAAKAPEVPAATAPAPDEGSGKAVQTEMYNVLYHLTNNTVARLQSVSGELLPTGKNELVVFDDKTSFELRVTNGTIFITPQALSRVLNEYVLARDDSPLKDLALEIRDDRMIIKGKLHGKGDLSFETAGSLSPNGDGRLRLSTERVKALHVPVTKVMSLFGIDLANVLTGKIPGIEAEGNDLLLDLGKMLPPPHIRGKVTSVRLENNAIVAVFGDGGKNLHALPELGNYMRFEGNRIRFGRLTMDNTDLTVVDIDPKDPLDWNHAHYREQVEAGYSKLTPHFGLQVYVKDYAKLSAKTSQ